MRGRKKTDSSGQLYKILIIDDEVGVIDSFSVILKRNGYKFIGITNPLEGIEILKNEHYDILILDYLMQPMNGDKVVKKIREFNKELYILLLTGHKDLAPPITTVKNLEIQGYCEKSDRFDQLLLLIESGIKSVSQMRMIKRFRDGLNRILLSVPKIYQLQPIDNILEDLLVEILPLVNSENAFIIVDDMTDIKNSDNKSIFKGIGKYKTDIDNFMKMLDTSFMEQLGYSRTMKKEVVIKEGIIFPLINEYKEAMGVFYVESKNIVDGYKLLEIYSKQAASSINNAFLHSLVNIKNEELDRTYKQLRKRYMDTIEALRLVVDAKDIYTRGHSDRVAALAVKTGKAMGLSDKEIETIRISGIFHDIGKIGTSEDILLKADRLDKDEYEEIKKHPLKSAHILSAISMFKDVVPVVKCHHERIDGKGYPQGLKGEQIPLLARIISVVDAFDAMMSDRLYRTRLSFNEALDQLKKGAGTQFDSYVVEKFTEIAIKYKFAEEDTASYNINYEQNQNHENNV
jgi:HD-GYP domain-containing protein (c-di-GMP phosphodiesterase class II)/CheY-like chemotaxis protein